MIKSDFFVWHQFLLLLRLFSKMFILENKEGWQWKPIRSWKARATEKSGARPALPASGQNRVPSEPNAPNVRSNGAYRGPTPKPPKSEARSGRPIHRTSMKKYRNHLKKVFWPKLCVGFSFQLLEIRQYSSGLNLEPALILNQNPNFEMASKQKWTLKIAFLPAEAGSLERQTWKSL